MTDERDTSAEGNIYRHEAEVGDPNLSPGDPELIDDVTRHLETHLGSVGMVFHEIVSPYAHIDVHHFPPTPTRSFHVLATTGMSERPMTVPDGVPDDWRFAELLVNLPADWQLSQAAFEDERFYWPVRNLKMLARLPHMYATWLSYAHTVPNGDPPEPYASNTKLCGMILIPPLSLTGEIHRLERRGGQVIRFWNLLPLYAGEMELKLKKGEDELFKLLDQAEISDIVDVDRQNVAARKWWPF